MRVLLILLAGLGVGNSLAAAPTPKTEDKPRSESPAERIRKVLDSRTDLEYASVNLPAVLAQLSEAQGVNYILDKLVIQQIGAEPNDLMVDVKLKDVKVRSGLRTMLGQFNLTYVVVGESIIVTTEEVAIYKQLKQRVNVEYDVVPLNDALKHLAKAHGINIVIDPKTAKNKVAETPVTLFVEDVPIEAAIRLMCEMAALKPTRMGNVIYVTTEDRADKLKDSEYLVPNPGLPGNPFVPGAPGNGNGMIFPGIGGVVPVAPVPGPVQEEKEKPIP